MLGNVARREVWKRKLTLAAGKMQRLVSSLSLTPSVKVKLVRAGFQFTADLLPLNPLALSAGTANIHQTAAAFLVTSHHMQTF